MTDEKMYCPSCGEDVSTFVVFEGEGESKCCFQCGMNLSAAASRNARILDYMLVAEDSLVFREVLKDKVEELGIAKEVGLAGNGEEFLETFTQRAFAKKPLSVAVLDIRMPGMNGMNAAMALRAIERGLGKKKPVPILFFSSLKCDDTLREVFKRCAPARYINKGNATSPDELSDRLVEVINRLMLESSRKSA